MTGGGTAAVLARIGSSQVSLANFARQAGLDQAGALAEADRLVAANQAEYTFLGAVAAQILRSQGVAVPERDGRPLRGFKMTGVT